MADRESKPSTGQPDRSDEHTLVFDSQWPQFKRTLSTEPGGLGAGIPFSHKGSRGRKSPRVPSRTR